MGNALRRRRARARARLRRGRTRAQGPPGRSAELSRRQR